MRIFHLIDNLEKVNLGIWQAAVSTADILLNVYHLPNIICVRNLPTNFDSSALPVSCQLIDLSKNPIPEFIKSDILVSHGCWQWPTRQAAKWAAKYGLAWVYTPHGMLEPWSMSQKKIKKKLYFWFYEGPMSRKAKVIRAVSSSEKANLQHLLARPICLIPNGVADSADLGLRTFAQHRNFVFMARLHPKKGLLELVQAWKTSGLAVSKDCKLTIAGPDDGLLTELNAHINGIENITYLGPVYGSQKNELLAKSHFYVLPSYSEGFPTSVLEAMQAGCIGLISKGCNFLEALDAGAALEAPPEPDALVQVLRTALEMSPERMRALSDLGSQFIKQQYLLAHIAARQLELYKSL